MIAMDSELIVDMIQRGSIKLRNISSYIFRNFIPIYKTIIPIYKDNASIEK
jgi:hypothetical protein